MAYYQIECSPISESRKKKEVDVNLLRYGLQLKINPSNLCVCVCVCERERERERDVCSSYYKLKFPLYNVQFKLLKFTTELSILARKEIMLKKKDVYSSTSDLLV